MDTRLVPTRQVYSLKNVTKLEIHSKCLLQYWTFEEVRGQTVLSGTNGYWCRWSDSEGVWLLTSCPVVYLPVIFI